MNSPYCWLLLLLAACTGTSQGTMSAPTTHPSCPICPEPDCKETVCPPTTCPACPQVATSPIATDWHCFDVPRRKSGDVGLCWDSAEGCEEMRKFVENEKVGTPSACTAQPTAFCVGIRYSNVWRRDCASTHEGCEKAREVIRKDPPTEHYTLGTCQLTRNINLFDALNANAAASGP